MAELYSDDLDLDDSDDLDLDDSNIDDGISFRQYSSIVNNVPYTSLSTFYFDAQANLDQFMLQRRTHRQRTLSDIVKQGSESLYNGLQTACTKWFGLRQGSTA